MTTISDLLPAYEDYLRHERQSADLTVIAYLGDLRGLADFCQAKPVSEIAVNDLRAYMRDLSHQGFKTATIRRKFHGFGTFWHWLKMEKHASDVITEQLKLPRKPRQIVKWLNENDLRTLIETPVARSDGFAARDTLAWKLLAWLGLRRSEVVDLEVGDIRFVDGVILIRAAKGDKDRLLPLPPELEPNLRAFIGTRTAGLLFRGAKGRGWSVQSFNRAFRSHLKTCGLSGKGITPHTLRHTFATHLVRSGVSIVTVSKLLGHADIQSTMIYVHVDMGQMKEAIENYVLSKTESSYNKND